MSRAKFMLPPAIRQEIKERQRLLRQAEREALKRRDFPAALVAAGRNAGPERLFRWYGRGIIGPDELRSLLPEVWQMAEWPERTLGAEWWIRLFRRVGFVADVDGTTAPTGPLTIFRGCTPERRNGLAWTTDQARAEWFARRDRDFFGFGAAAVYTATAPPEGVLAVILGREESEVLIDPGALASIRAARPDGP